MRDQQPNGDDALSVRNLLELAYDCHNTLKGRIDGQVRALKAAGDHWPDVTVEPDPGRWILGHIWRLDNVLQCMTVERILELRHQSPRVPLIPAAMESRPYSVTQWGRAREDRCVKSYKDDEDFGAKSQKPQ